MKSTLLKLVVSFLVLLFANNLRAQWSNDPTVNTPVSTAINQQSTPQIISDGTGGAIIAWVDDRNGTTNNNIYAQKIDANGTVHTGWTVDGIAICTTPYQQFGPTLLSDGAGGAIITWADSRNGTNDIYAQRIDADGTIHTGWPTNGVAICTAAINQTSPQIISDGAGGAIITWRDDRTTSLDYDIYAQRVDADGIIHTGWTTDGVAICTAVGSDQSAPQLTSDGAGGAIITWRDKRSGDNDIYAQRIDANGTIHSTWTANGVAVCIQSKEQTLPQIISDGAGGAIITWEDKRSGNSTSYDIYAQRIDTDGTIHTGWTGNGVTICTAANIQNSAQITSDGFGGAIITWQDFRVDNTYSDVYAQRIDAGGVTLWTTDGVAISAEANNQSLPQIKSDGAGGAIITWYDLRNGSDYDVYAQKVDANGAVQWTTNGIPVSTATNNQSLPQLISDGIGGAIITWEDLRNGTDNNVYAARIFADGMLASTPAPPQNLVVADSSSGSITIAWRQNTEPDFLRYYIYRGTSPNPIVRIDSTTGGIGDTSKTFTGLVNGTRYYFRVKAIDSSQVASDYSNEVNAVPADRIAPVAPQNLLITDSSSHSITIKWRKNIEIDLRLYRIYRDTIPNPITKVDSTTGGIEDTTKTIIGLTNGRRYYIRITAVDSSGNESDFSNEVNAVPADRIAPNAPQNLVVTDSSSQKITIKWRRNTEADFLRYRIYRDTIPNPIAKVDSTMGGINDTSKTFTGLTNGKRYYFRVTAVDSASNESSYSNEVNAMPAPLIVISFSPVRNALDVTKETSITVKFSYNIDTLTLCDTTIRINGSLSGLHKSTFSYNSNTYVSTLNPTTDFQTGELVTVILTRRIRNTSGDSLGSAQSWSFIIETGTATAIFTQSDTVSVGNYPISVTAGDFDGDKDIDLAVANSGSNTISILLNDGSGSFTQNSTPGVGNGPYSVTSSDFNGDGNVDLAVVNESSNTVSILLNNGSGSFTQSSTPSVGSIPYSVTSSDFNGDGNVDLAVVNEGSNTVSILLNNGNGIFTQSSTPAVGNRPWSITSGDFDGDGDIDLATANEDANTVSILLNNGSGVFAQGSTPTVGNSPWSIISGDLDGDRDIDLAVANLGDNTVSILLNNGSGTFIQSSTPSVGSFPWSITASDIDGDSDIDLAVVNGVSNTVSILLNNGSGAFTSRPAVAVGNAPESITPGDFDGDGDIDLAVVNNGSNTINILSNANPLSIIAVTPASNALNVAKNSVIGIAFNRNINQNTVSTSTVFINGSQSGKHTFTTSYSSSTKTDALLPTVQFKVGELVTVSATSSIKSPFGDPLLHSKIWSFTIKSDTATGTFIQTSTPGVGRSPYSATTGDLDGDGDIDLVTTNTYDNSISILWNNLGHFTQSTTLGVGTSPHAVAAYDFDRDGDIDLAVAYGDVTGTVSIFSNNNDSTFTEIATPGVGNGPASITGGDFDGDGDIDLATADDNSNTVSILLNDGSGGFTMSDQLSVGAYPYWIITGDFDGDGDIDLAVATYGSNAVSILINNGSGEFVQSSVLGGINWPYSIVAADFDNDGDIDLATANHNSNTISIFKNNSIGSFTQSSTLGVGSGPKSIISGDFDGDGDIDLAVTNQFSNTISILMNNGSGTFTQSSTTNVGTDPFLITAADFDGDGDIDLTTTNFTSNTVSILLNVNPTSVENTRIDIPTQFGLAQNYPNPFNPATVIKYQLPASSSVTLSVYDILGREVTILADGIKEAGSYTVTFDGSRFASGIYLTRFVAQPLNGNNTFMQVKKMMLTK